MRRECRERFPPPPISKETASWRSRHASRHVRDARAVMHVGIAHPRWRGKRSRHSRRMRTHNFAYLARGPWTLNPQTSRCIPSPGPLSKWPPRKRTILEINFFSNAISSHDPLKMRVKCNFHALSSKLSSHIIRRTINCDVFINIVQSILMSTQARRLNGVLCRNVKIAYSSVNYGPIISCKKWNCVCTVVKNCLFARESF